MVSGQTLVMECRATSSFTRSLLLGPPRNHQLEITWTKVCLQGLQHSDLRLRVFETFNKLIILFLFSSHFSLSDLYVCMYLWASYFYENIYFDYTVWLKCIFTRGKISIIFCWMLFHKIFNSFYNFLFS